jgi:histone acetyltransferase (RNA polymerase elongator complex component)
MDYEIEDIETIHKKFQGLIAQKNLFDHEVKQEEEGAYLSFIRDLLYNTSTLDELKKKYGIMRKNSVIIQFSRKAQKRGLLSLDQVTDIEEKLRIKRHKSHSGVLVVTIFTSAYPEYINEEGKRVQQPFSCKWNCHYCPNQPGQPRSYLEGEPGVLRANANDFDCCNQMWDRMGALYNTGHPIDKLEVLVLGGTWESYPMSYRKEFIRDMYYAANTFWEEPSERRTKASLAVERDANRDALCKIIGLTLETRPDTIDTEAIITAREFGCTRFQIGIQHTNDMILQKINRKCPTWKTVQAIQLLKDWGFKVDGHWMPNLPGATPELDRKMFVEELLAQSKEVAYIQPYIEGIYDWSVWTMTYPDLQLDQWKIYPCEVVPYTEIETWHKEGLYKPYGETEMEALLMETKRNMVPWIRLNRIIRDIPTDYIISSGDHPSMRQVLQRKMKSKGWKCNCIRCREVKRTKIPDQIYYRIREYNSSYGTEFFVSAEDITGDVLCGFLRLRHNDSDIGWIRELHVYGQLQVTGQKEVTNHVTQHKGIGKTLMEFARKISLFHNKRKMKVISGEGTKRYYEKLGYREGEYGYMELAL